MPRSPLTLGSVRQALQGGGGATVAPRSPLHHPFAKSDRQLASCTGKAPALAIIHQLVYDVPCYAKTCIRVDTARLCRRRAARDAGACFARAERCKAGQLGDPDGTWRPACLKCRQVSSASMKGATCSRLQACLSRTPCRIATQGLVHPQAIAYRHYIPCCACCCRKIVSGVALPDTVAACALRIRPFDAWKQAAPHTG